jgi:hypothetical protein
VEEATTKLFLKATIFPKQIMGIKLQAAMPTPLISREVTKDMEEVREGIPKVFPNKVNAILAEYFFTLLCFVC